MTGKGRGGKSNIGKYNGEELMYVEKGGGKVVSREKGMRQENRSKKLMVFWPPAGKKEQGSQRALRWKTRRGGCRLIKTLSARS